MPYAQDFEALDQANTDALANDGWLVFGNVFAPDGAYLYGYGPFPAPNDGFAFCAIAAGEGGPDQGDQQLVVFSDYNNTDHADGNLIESNVFQEQIIEAGDLGQTWMFTFDAKLGNIEGGSTALAFIKTIDSGNYEGSGIFYDNVFWDVDGAVAVEPMTLSGVKSLFK
jgi:hypothetical protein